jgi:hypothetical protein
MDSTTKQTIIVAAAGTLGAYVLFFGIPFHGTINNYVHNRQLLKQQKMRYEHEERMAKINHEEK